MNGLPRSILLLNKEYAPHIGGIETVVRQLAEHWARQGVQTRVLCTGARFSEETIGGVKVVRAPVNCRVGSARLSFSFLKLFSSLAGEADVLHFHYPNPIGEIALLASRLPPKRGRKILCTYHSDAARPAWLVPGYNRLSRAFLKRCGSIVCASPEYLESSPNLVHFRSKTAVIPYGISRKRMQNLSEETLARAEALAAPLPRPRLLFAGRFAYYKGLSHLLDAMPLLPECSLLMVGEGSEEDALRGKIEDLGLSSRVRMIPPLDDELYPAVFRAADVFVLPSTHRTEAFGIVGIEAMMGGLPLVTTSLGTGTTFYNLDGVTGRVARPADPAGLAECVKWVLEDSTRHDLLGKKAATRAETFFSEERMLQEYWKLYTS